MNRPANRFNKGSGMYACRICGRNTRSTGRGDNENCGLCVQCFELAGIENAFADGNDEPGYLKTAAHYCDQLKALGIADPQSLFSGIPFPGKEAA